MRAGGQSNRISKIEVTFFRHSGEGRGPYAAIFEGERPKRAAKRHFSVRMGPGLRRGDG